MRIAGIGLITEYGSRGDFAEWLHKGQSDLSSRSMIRKAGSKQVAHFRDGGIGAQRGIYQPASTHIIAHLVPKSSVNVGQVALGAGER